MIKKLFLTLTSVIISLYTYSQDVNVSGKVTDGNGNPVSGAIVIEKGTSNGVRTGSDGSYTLTVPANRIPTSVMARYLGLGSLEVAVDGTSTDVSFNPSLGGQSNRSINEVVVSASKKSEKILNAPASVSILSESRIQQNSSLSVVDNLRKVAAVDLMPTGLVSNNVVVRGFNNIFSGATMFMIDNRLASVPSLRVNAFQLVPTSNVDVRSMELVRGPASALYGPFASNGVIAVYTKSPLDMENRMEVTVGLTTGARSGDDDNAAYGFVANNSLENLGILNPEIRIAGKLSKNVGLKVSGNYLSGSDFAFFDAREPNNRTVRFGNQSGGAVWASDGTAPQTFNRDFKIRKISGEAKMDWRPSDKTEVSFATGYSNNTNVELTGLGGAQAVGWTSNYFQTQFKKDRFYAQYYINATNSGNTYLIPQSPTQSTFTYLKETSNLQSIQLQHSSKALKNNLGLVYGIDVFMTRPSGNVYGRFDKNANINQYGGYLQGDYKFSAKWKATLAARMDYQDVIDEWMFSPRAALVYKPEENHTFRMTYNRSFAAPTALNFFLDLNNGGITGTSNSIRAFGNTGMNYNLGPDGLPLVTTSGGSNLPYTALSNPALITNVKTGLRQVLIGQLMAAGAPLSSATASANLLLTGINPTSLAPVDLVTGKAVDVSTITNKPAVSSSVNQTAEIGYKGLIMDKLSLGIDFYYTRISNFSSPLSNVTYQVTVDPSYYGLGTTQAQMLANINAAGPFRSTLVAGLTGNPSSSDAEIIKAYTTALVRAGAIANTGTIAPDNTGTGNDVVLTYLNLGTVDVAGTDVSFNYAASNVFNIEGAVSYVNKDRIPLLGAAEGFISLNAPKFKSALNLEYKLPIDKNAVSVRAGWRWMDKFDGNSGVSVGRVNSVNLLDLGFSWRPSASQSTVLSLNINNLLDHRHAFFPNSSAIGRVALFKLMHTFGVR